MSETVEGADARARREAIEAVFEEALDVAPDRRQAWLAARCGADDSLAAEVLALLEGHERTGGILDAPPAAVARSIVADDARDRRIGPYRVLRELGRGGMGVVYLAERSDGQFRRRVAVKLLRASPDADELHQRFLAERQILASLSHPHIAQLLDGGVADGQLPYLVIEYVDGQPITEYCDRQRLDIEERLRLFQDVCAAVDHAHRNLVLHRDLKPGNILVTSDAQVKLLDFGIAKLLNPSASFADVPVTRTAFRLMTPAYASPEQVRGDTLTTASDVYALGLILYELLTGYQVQQVAGDTPQAVLAAICDQEAERPSTRVLHDDGDGARVRAAADARGMQPLRLAKRLHGDIDAIVLMALRKEAARRYGSADLLAADIARHLDGLPVLAHRGSRWYRTSKFLRRHRRMAVAGAGVTLSLVGGLSLAMWQRGIAERERDRATAALATSERARLESEEVTNFLVALFEASDPSEGRQDTLSAADLLRRGVARAERLGQVPLVQARLFDALGSVELSLGHLEDGERHIARSLALRQRVLGDTSLETAASAARLADVWRRRGEYARADSLAAVALDIRRARLAPSDPDVAASLRQLSSIAVYRDDLDRAITLIRESLTARRASGQSDDSTTVEDLLALGSVQWRRGALSEGVETLREAAAVSSRLGPRPNRQHAEVGLRLSERLADDPRQLANAEALARDALAELQEALGEEHPRVAGALGQVAHLLSLQGAHADAEAMQRSAVDLVRRTYGPRHTNTAGAMNALANMLVRAGRYRDAERLSREALPIWAENVGRRHSAYAGALAGLAVILEHQGMLDSAVAMHREAVAIRSDAVGPNSALTAITSISLARALVAKRRFAEADSIMRWVLPILLAHQGERHPDVLFAHRVMAQLYEQWGREEDAARHRQLALGAEAPREIP